MTTKAKRKKYHCDTSDYWCSADDYNNKDKKFGQFIDDGKAFQITDSNTPRPWLNYLVNPKFGSVLSNTGEGFTWFTSTRLRITHYCNTIDYLPRTFNAGRDIYVTDSETGEEAHIFKDGENLVCTHRPGHSVIETELLGMKFKFTLFVPLNDTCEIWIVTVTNPADEPRNITFRAEQEWSFKKQGEEDSENFNPDNYQFDWTLLEGGLSATMTKECLPYPEMFGLFTSPQANSAHCTAKTDNSLKVKTSDNYLCSISGSLNVPANNEASFQVISGGSNESTDMTSILLKYKDQESCHEEFEKVKDHWDNLQSRISCETPDKNFQNFLNVWLKNQLNLTFWYCRSGYWGYRDVLQDDWGFTLLDPQAAERRLMMILSHQWSDGTAPRQFSKYGDDEHDNRKFMDSCVWIPKLLLDLIKETGNPETLNEVVPFLDKGSATLEKHVSLAMDYLYDNRGQHGGCLTGDGDWNDALEGIGKDEKAESFWLTIAFYDALNHMIELYEHLGDRAEVKKYKFRAQEIKRVVDNHGWDGDWYIYGIKGNKEKIGSKENAEGQIHLNSQTWAVFSGLADEKRGKRAMQSVSERLDTKLGPMLVDPPYVNDGENVGRIAGLEPGTFENGSIYQHAVTFHIFASLKLGHNDKAFETFVNLLPTNPENFDTRRSSEPYSTGNFYCGKNHERFGQNFFTWFSGNASWLIRAGFDEMLGVKAGFNGLKINPKVPSDWNEYKVNRTYRGCKYQFTFKRELNQANEISILVDGMKIDGNTIPISDKPTCSIVVYYS